MGWVTKVTEYSRAKVMNANTNVTMMITKDLTRTSMSSAVSRTLLRLDRSLSRISFNFLLQNWCHKIFGAGLRKITRWVLALGVLEMFGVLAGVAVAIFAANKYPTQKNNYTKFHSLSFFCFNSALIFLASANASCDLTLVVLMSMSIITSMGKRMKHTTANKTIPTRK